MNAFYLSPHKWDKLVLEDQEALHVHALRLEHGAQLRLLDGQGRVATCRVAKLGKKKVELDLLEESFFEAPKSRAIMAIAISKAARRGFFLEKASELGAWAVWIWQAERSQGKLSDGLLNSCQNQLIAGLKQSHNPWLPQLRSFANASEVAAAASQADLRILPWEEQAGGALLGPELLGQAGETVYVIGPEGGFAERETSILKDAGFITTSLGKRVLRCETAATLCLGLHWHASQLPGHPDFSPLEKTE